MTCFLGTGEVVLNAGPNLVTERGARDVFLTSIILKQDCVLAVIHLPALCCITLHIAAN
jgi:hypothetical protein